MRNIFVAMPFVTANGRDQQALTKFFDDYIKYPIEKDADLRGKYLVKRSSDDFAILDQIILDIVNADIVICDLSGAQANPNVIYELGLRLATSHKPVILIREEHENNQHIFDVSGLYAQKYSVSDTRPLERFLIEKIKEYESSPEKFSSPVLKVLNHEAAFWMQLPTRKASAFLGGIASAAEAHLKAFSRALAIFVRGNGISDFHIENAVLCSDAFAKIENQDLLDNFDYSVISIPSLDSYLSSVYLLGLVEDDVERSFREYAMAYSLYFNKNNAPLFWASRFEASYAYAVETLILMNLARLIIRILAARQGSSDRQELIERFKENLKSSNLLDQGK